MMFLSTLASDFRDEIGYKLYDKIVKMYLQNWSNNIMSKESTKTFYLSSLVKTQHS